MKRPKMNRTIKIVVKDDLVCEDCIPVHTPLDRFIPDFVDTARLREKRKEEERIIVKKGDEKT